MIAFVILIFFAVSNTSNALPMRNEAENFFQNEENFMKNIEEKIDAVVKLGELENELENQENLLNHDGMDNKFQEKSDGKEKEVESMLTAPDTIQINPITNPHNSQFNIDEIIGPQLPSANAEVVASQSENFILEHKEVTKSSNQHGRLATAAALVEVSPSPASISTDAQVGRSNLKKETHRKLFDKKVAVRFDSNGDSIHEDSTEVENPSKNCKQKKEKPTKLIVALNKHRESTIPLNNDDLIDPLNEPSSDTSDDDDESESEFFADDGIPVIKIPLADILKEHGLQLRRVDSDSESDASGVIMNAIAQDFEHNHIKDDSL